MFLGQQCTHSLETGLASAGRLTQGMFHRMGQMAADTHYCILQTLATECELDKTKARRPPPPGRTDHSSPPLHNSSRKTVYFSEKPVTSLPAEKPG